MIDSDASIVVCHSEKEQEAPTFKKTFGYHPMRTFCGDPPKVPRRDPASRERGSNTAADHISVLDAGLAPLPGTH